MTFRRFWVITPSPLETLFFTNLPQVNIGRDFGAVKGLRSPVVQQNKGQKIMSLS